MEAWNGKALVSGEPDLIIETDASRKGWGASCMGQTTGGRWSLQEQHLHINCLELLAGAFALKAFTKNNAGSTVDGQHISNALHQQNGGDQVPNFGLSSKKSVGMVSRTSDCARNTSYPRRFKYSGRQGVPSLCGQQRLETRTPSVRQSKSGLGPPKGSSICHSSVKTAHPLRQLETGSRGRVGQCLGSGLQQFSRLRISPIFVGGTLPKTGDNPKCTNTSVNSPRVENSLGTLSF